MRLGSILDIVSIGARFLLTAALNPFNDLARSPRTWKNWPIGSKNVGLNPWPWNRRVFIGFRPFRSLSVGGLRFGSSMPDRSRMSLDAKLMFWTANGCNGYIAMACSTPLFARGRDVRIAQLFKISR